MADYITSRYGTGANRTGGASRTGAGYLIDVEGEALQGGLDTTASADGHDEASPHSSADLVSV